MIPIDLPDDWVPIIAVTITAFGVVIGAAIAFLGVWLKLRADGRALAQQIDTQIDERIARELKEAWARIDAQQARIIALEKTDEERALKHAAQMAAVGRILRAIQRQWPDDNGPDLDPHDIALLEDTIPAAWLRPRKDPT